MRRRIGCAAEVRRKSSGSSSEEAIEPPEQVAVNILGNSVVSTMIKLEMGGDPINLILGQLGPSKTQIGPNGLTHSDPDFCHAVQPPQSGGGTA